MVTAHLIRCLWQGWLRAHAAITITRNDHDSAGFRRAAAASRDADAARRMLAFALVLDGASWASLRVCSMDQGLLVRGKATGPPEAGAIMQRLV